MDRRIITLALAILLLSSPSWARMGGMMGMWGAAGAAGPFLSDTFTETNTVAISSHAPDVVGVGNWNDSAGTTQINLADYAERSSGTTWGKPYHPTTPPSANYSVTASVVLASTATDRRGGACARMASDGDGYCAAVSSANGVPGTLLLYRFDNTTPVLLKSQTLTTNHALNRIYQVKVTVNGTDISATELLDNITISADGGDATYQDSGYAGIAIYNSATRINDVVAQ